MSLNREKDLKAQGRNRVADDIKRRREAQNKAGASSSFKKGSSMADLVLDGGLGTLGDDKDIQGALGKKTSVIDTSKDMVDRSKSITDRYEKMADEGMSKEATDALRSKMASQMGVAERMAGMKMGGAMGGAKGASAMAQARSLQAQGMMGRANIERDIFLDNEKMKVQGLQGMTTGMAGEQASLQGLQSATDSYTTSLGQVKQFDIGQKTTEKQLRGSMAMQYEQMASAERAAKVAAEAQVAAAKAQKSEGITVVCTEMHRQGIIDTATWEANTGFGKYLYRVDPYGYFGYMSWGLPLANAMSKSKIITKIATPFMKGWINYIAGEETLFNKTMYVLGRQFGNTLISIKKKFKQASLKG